MQFFVRSASLILAATVMAAPAIAANAVTLHPKLTKGQATAIARKAIKSGKIVGVELEAEKGGSGLRYSFDVKDGAFTREVGVDANTGAVLENAVEGKHPD